MLEDGERESSMGRERTQAGIFARIFQHHVGYGCTGEVCVKNRMFVICLYSVFFYSFVPNIHYHV